ncbi:hypothetical protein ACFFX0_15075 [Citricoccus parietis]|uniref:Uncharacterized protein n=1 Tax=Citricoccus parietis TaxID=592307 RepID=A0ABV5G0I6_9MICC
MLHLGEHHRDLRVRGDAGQQPGQQRRAHAPPALVGTNGHIAQQHGRGVGEGRDDGHGHGVRRLADHAHRGRAPGDVLEQLLHRDQFTGREVRDQQALMHPRHGGRVRDGVGGRVGDRSANGLSRDQVVHGVLLACGGDDHGRRGFRRSGSRL